MQTVILGPTRPWVLAHPAVPVGGPTPEGMA